MDLLSKGGTHCILQITVLTFQILFFINFTKLIIFPCIELFLEKLRGGEEGWDALSSGQDACEIICKKACLLSIAAMKQAWKSMMPCLTITSYNTMHTLYGYLNYGM